MWVGGINVKNEMFFTVIRLIGNYMCGIYTLKLQKNISIERNLTQNLKG